MLGALSRLMRVRLLTCFLALGITLGPAQPGNAEIPPPPCSTCIDLAVALSDSPDPVRAGAEITYTIDLSNAGPGIALGVTLTDQIPAKTTFVSFAYASPSGGADAVVTAPPAGAGGVVVVRIPTLTANDVRHFVITVKVDADAADGWTITNTAAATAAAPPEARPQNNTATAVTVVEHPLTADLAVTMSENRSPYTVTAGSPAGEKGPGFIYFISLRNDGPHEARGVKLTDATPDHTTFRAFTQTGGPPFALSAPSVGGTGTASATISALPSGATASFELGINVDANTPDGSTLVNRAAVASDTLDPVPTNNNATTTTGVHAFGRLGISITDSPDPVMPASNLTYVLKISSGGPSDTQNVRLSDEIPASTTFVSFRQDSGPTFVLTTPVGDPGAATASVTATIGTLAAGVSATFTLVVNVDPSTGDGAQISNTAKATSTTHLAVYPPGPNPATVTTRVSTFAADLSVDVSDAPDPVEAGGHLSYTITVANSGPGRATGVSLADYFSYQTTKLVSWSQDSGPDFALSGCCEYTPRAEGTLAAGESATFTLVVRVKGDITAGTLIENTATVSSDASEPAPGNNSASATTTVVAASSNADLFVAVADDRGGEPVTAGGQSAERPLTYLITLRNDGPSDSLSVTLTDEMPLHTTFLAFDQTSGPAFALSAPPRGATGVATATSANLPAGATATFTFSVAVDADARNDSWIADRAIVDADTNDPVPGSNLRVAWTRVRTMADLRIAIADSPDPVRPGADLTYVIQLSNEGPSDAQNVRLSDAVPQGTHLVSFRQDSGPQFALESEQTATIETLAASATATFTLVVNVDPSSADGTELSNTASATSTTQSAMDPSVYISVTETATTRVSTAPQ
jgi:uncharacterized repeat protein (TIGR01451 family)